MEWNHSDTWDTLSYIGLWVQFEFEMVNVNTLFYVLEMRKRIVQMLKNFSNVKPHELTLAKLIINFFNILRN